MSRKPAYEFCGPLGASAVSFLLPVFLAFFNLACNETNGCPVPSLLRRPSQWSWSEVRAELFGHVEAGPDAALSSLLVKTFVNKDAILATLAYFLVSLVLYAVLPAETVDGVQLRNGKRLKYRLNTFATNMFIYSVCLAGTLSQGSRFVLWTFIDEHFHQLYFTNVALAFLLATYTYVRSFEIKPGRDNGLRELAQGGVTGNLIYDWFIGRELNPRITLPLIGEVDIKQFMEQRPGLLAWSLFNFAWLAKQHRNYGYVTDSSVFVALVQAYYNLDSVYFESSVLTTMDITTDGFGFMLSFGDIAWVPFFYSQQTRYLATHPVSLGPWGLAAMVTILLTGYTIFRLSNSQKNAFRANPNDPSVAHLKYINTKRGTRLLISGWWGMARHINYLGDLIQAIAYCAPAGVAGYLVFAAGSPEAQATLAQGSTTEQSFFVAADGRVVTQGAARGWGMIFTFFYMVYFTTLLVHRDRRDSRHCQEKYGDDWARYQKIVRWRILPYVY